MQQGETIIFESYLDKCSRANIFSEKWRKKYFILLNCGEIPYLLYYDKKPDDTTHVCKKRLCLGDGFQLLKDNNYGKRYTCILIVDTCTLYLGTEDSGLFNMFVFFTQTQQQLREELEDECFVVRPNNSQAHRLLGSRGSICCLHLSQWGLTLAIQLSKCVLAQWPLSCIKNYESNSRGQFSIFVGVEAPMGPGRYDFNTRIGQDDMLYDKLDLIVMEASAIQPFDKTPFQTLSNGLRSLTKVKTDERFIPHLRKISRDIYDHLDQLFGTSSSRRLYNNYTPSPSNSSDGIRHTSVPALDVNGSSHCHLSSKLSSNSNQSDSVFSTSPVGDDEDSSEEGGFVETYQTNAMPPCKHRPPKLGSIGGQSVSGPQGRSPVYADMSLGFLSARRPHSSPDVGDERVFPFSLRPSPPKTLTLEKLYESATDPEYLEPRRMVPPTDFFGEASVANPQIVSNSVVSSGTLTSANLPSHSLLQHENPSNMSPSQHVSAISSHLVSSAPLLQSPVLPASASAQNNHFQVSSSTTEVFPSSVSPSLTTPPSAMSMDTVSENKFLFPLDQNLLATPKSRIFCRPDGHSINPNLGGRRLPSLPKLIHDTNC